jgi:hypothetical protein
VELAAHAREPPTLAFGSAPGHATAHGPPEIRRPPPHARAAAALAQGIDARKLQAFLLSAHAEVDGVKFIVQGRKIQLKVVVNKLNESVPPLDVLMPLQVNIVYYKNGDPVGKIETDKEENLELLSMPLLELAKVAARRGSSISHMRCAPRARAQMGGSARLVPRVHLSLRACWSRGISR